MQTERVPAEKPFSGTKVYFSNSIKGVLGDSEDLGIPLVKFMSTLGVDVLSENVAYLDPKEGLPIFEKRTGINLSNVSDPQKRAEIIRSTDISWVDEADILIAVVNGASYGVGMELQRAIDLSEMLGKNPKPILCLVHEERLDKLSSMVRGVNPEKEGVVFEIATYKDQEEALLIVHNFLSVHKSKAGK